MSDINNKECLDVCSADQCSTSQQGDEAACGGTDTAALAGTSSAPSLGIQFKELDDKWTAYLESSPGYLTTEQLAVDRVSCASSLEGILTAYTESVDHIQKYFLTSLKEEITKEQLLQATQLESGHFDRVVTAFKRLLEKLITSFYDKAVKPRLLSEFYNSSAMGDVIDLDCRIDVKCSECLQNFDLEAKQLLLEMNRQTPDEGTEVGVATTIATRANSSDNKDLPHPSK